MRGMMLFSSLQLLYWYFEKVCGMMIPAPISAGFSDVANYSPLMQTSSEKEVFRTELVEKPSSWKIDHSKHLLFLGSCFSENIGELLKTYKLNVCINPLGIIYNPQSVEATLSNIISPQGALDSDIIFDEDTQIYHSWNAHSRFSSMNKAELISKVNEETKRAHNFLLHADILFVTLGSTKVLNRKLSIF